MGSAVSIPVDKDSFSEQDLKHLLGDAFDRAKFCVLANNGSVTRAQLEQLLIRLEPLAIARAGSTVTCEARVKASLDAITAHDINVGACVDVLEDSAIAQAVAADERLLAYASGSGKADGTADSDTSPASRRVLEGVPMLVKCNIDVAGSLSSNGTPALAAFRPTTTAPVVERLQAAGAIIVAKTNMPESAMGLWGWSPPHGLTKNPRNGAYTTGGSSAGTAAGIAAGFVRCGLGSDTGGSCRIPAACCGIVGLRPSRGRYPLDGVIPCSPEHDTVGPMAATAADLALVDAVCAGDDTSAEALAIPDSLAGTGVALAVDCYAETDDAQKAALGVAIAALEAVGAKRHEAGVELKKAVSFEFERPLSYRERGMDDYLASHEGCGTTTAQLLEGLGSPILKAFHTVAPPMNKTMTGATLTNVKALGVDELAAAEEKHATQLTEYTAQYTKVFEAADVEVIMTPAIGGGPAKALAEDDYKDFGKAAPAFAMVRAGGALAGFFNDLPVPSLSLPVPSAGTYDGDSNIPVSVLLWGKPGADKKLIQVAMALERTLNAPAIAATPNPSMSPCNAQAAEAAEATEAAEAAEAVEGGDVLTVDTFDVDATADDLLQLLSVPSGWAKIVPGFEEDCEAVMLEQSQGFRMTTASKNWMWVTDMATEQGTVFKVRITVTDPEDKPCQRPTSKLFTVLQTWTLTPKDGGCTVERKFTQYDGSEELKGFLLGGMIAKENEFVRAALARNE